MKILAVDDSLMIRKIIKNATEILGYELIEACDGMEAMQIISKMHQEIEMVLLDWNMPKMSGYEILQKIKNSSEWKHLPVMMVTTEGQRENIIKAVKAGVNNYLTKPFTIEELTKKILETKSTVVLETVNNHINQNEITPEEFFESFNETLNQMSSLNFKRIDETKTPEMIESQENFCASEVKVSGAVTMVGDCSYMIVVTAGLETAKTISQYMTGISSPTENEIFDGIAEIANMTAGLAKTRSKEELSLRIFQPFVMYGTATKIVPRRKEGIYGAKFQGEECHVELKIFELD